MFAEPILRACPEYGPTLDDPSESLLLMLLEDIEKGEGTFLIVERPSDRSGETYAQVQLLVNGDWGVEYREGDAERHFGVVVSDIETAHRLLTGWAFQLADWDEGASWYPVVV